MSGGSFQRFDVKNRETGCAGAMLLQDHRAARPRKLAELGVGRPILGRDAPYCLSWRAVYPAALAGAGQGQECCFESRK